jgi:hypothetical protein
MPLYYGLEIPVFSDNTSAPSCCVISRAVTFKSFTSHPIRKTVRRVEKLESEVLLAIEPHRSLRSGNLFLESQVVFMFVLKFLRLS